MYILTFPIALAYGLRYDQSREIHEKLEQIDETEILVRMKTLWKGKIIIR